MSEEILVVDDEADIRDLISDILEDEGGYSTRTAGDSDAALAAVAQRTPSLVVLDIWLQGSRLDGLEILAELQRSCPDVPVVIISGHGNIETAVKAIKDGAYDFIEKPFKSGKLLVIVQRALEAYRLKQENRELRLKVPQTTDMIGNSSAMSQLRQAIEKVAATGSRVLISGPVGSGKEIVARGLHASSKRSEQPFVAVNSATISPDRMEEELFGVFSENGERRIGKLEQAHGGTLFLDEVADMPLETQNKILRVLVEQTFERLGGGPKVQVDVRVVSSSSKDLRTEIEAGRFREDLFHRLNVVPIEVPPLSQRRDDIPELIDYFMRQLSATSGLPARKIGSDATAALQAHDWPGNVRQLRNVIERILILGRGDQDKPITAEELPAEIGDSVFVVLRGGGEHIMLLPLREAREVFEREYLLAQTERFGGNISRTANFIEMERSALHRKLRSLGIRTSDRRRKEGESAEGETAETNGVVA